ncbi:MAG: FemAB family PEP-CTERM system-associated protein [Planctomycetes bacterium]|nr:FemAB family PEP-CTERM system-associated protein [Planctomycetota bacterium]MBI3835472.1 FemAB family PEP-CTERM system-associated protein [Planctomycetota bacterium]
MMQTMHTESRIEAIGPDREESWDEFVEAHPDGTLFHTLAWRNIVSSVFRHKPYYLAVHSSGRITGVLPLFFVKSIFGGRMLVSVPYAVSGGILAEDEVSSRRLWQEAMRLARELRCSVIDLRSASAGVPELPVIHRYVGFARPLPKHPHEVLDSLPRKARAAARNAREKYGLTVCHRNTNLRTIWNLYSRNMRRLGSLAYPFSLFCAIRSHMQNSHWVSVVHREGRPVASLVTLLYRDRVMPYLAGFSDEARDCSAANFLYLTLMERSVTEGYRIFDFGRSRIDNHGSFDFKRFQGFEPTPLEYQQWNPGGNAVNLSPSNPAFSFGRGIWSHLPLSVTQLLGGFLVQHIPG